MTAASGRIVARGLVRAFLDGERRTEVLKGVDLEIEPGELVAIVGPSGSGKSTLLHIIGALDTPDAGSVSLSGQQLAELDAAELADFRNRNIGFVFQFHQLLPDFDALENVMMPGRISGMAPARLHRRAEQLLVDVGLEQRLDYFPSQLSGGERQRVAICRALVLEPEILLADEPTGNLDEAAGAQVLELLIDLQRRQQTTALLVTHNPGIARRCGRVLALKDGLLHADRGH